MESTETTNASDELKAVDADQALLAFMRQRDVACPMCKYNLRNLASLKCPECGTKLALGVQQAEPHSRAWITAVVGLSLPSGIPVNVYWFIGYFWITGQLSSRLFFVGGIVVTYFFAWSLLSPVLLALVVIFRRRFQRLSRRVQWGIASGIVINYVFLIIWSFYEATH